MGRLIYKGPSAKDDSSSEFHVRDEDRKMHRLVQGQVSEELPDSLRAELLEGSDRTKGHKFEEPSDDDLKAAGIDAGSGSGRSSRRSSESETGGGSGGSSPAAGSGSATGTTPTA